MASRDECEHGSMRRSCEVCELEAQLAAERARADHLRRLADEAQDETSALVECIEESLPLYAYDNGDEGEPNIHERVAYAGDELRRVVSERDRLRAALSVIARGTKAYSPEGQAAVGWAMGLAESALAYAEAPDCWQEIRPEAMADPPMGHESAICDSCCHLDLTCTDGRKGQPACAVYLPGPAPKPGEGEKR